MEFDSSTWLGHSVVAIAAAVVAVAAVQSIAVERKEEEMKFSSQ